MSAAGTVHFRKADEQQRNEFAELLKMVGVPAENLCPPCISKRETAQIWMSPDKRDVVDQFADLYGVARSTILRVALSIGMSQIVESSRDY